jgi:hypothetical protein
VLNRSHCACALASDERFAPHWPFMIEQDAIGGMDAVRLAIIDGDPIRIELGSGIGRARIKRGGLTLWPFLGHSIKFGR